MPSNEFLARYRDLCPIGHGGMGNVFRAVQTSLGRSVAIKFMHGELGADPDFRRRFLDEGQLTARLDHPGVVRVYEYGMDGQTPYLVYELIEGEDLRSRMNRRPAIARDQALDWMLQVLDGLAAAHEIGIVHRDVKPENILLGAQGRVVLADFGLAREASAESRTAGGLVLGTPAYVAPEQIRGQRATPRTDVYAAATVVHELLCGRLPLVAATPAELLARKLKEDPPSPAAPGIGISPALARVLLTALARDPSSRFANAGEFRGALEAARQAPATGAPAGATRTMASSSRREAATTIAAGLASSARPVPAARPPVALLAVAALVAVLSFGLGFATGQWRARSQLSDPAAALGHLADSASIARTHEPLPDSAAGPRPETPVAQAQGPAGLERLVGEVRHELDFERVDRALAVHYPVLGRKGPAVQSMRAFWEAAGGTSLAARVGALVPRVRRGLTDPETTVSERARLYSVFEPLARLDAVLDFYGATTLLGWNELTAGMASTEPCADEPEHSGWQPVQTWPEMEQVLACSNMRVVEGERDFWNMVLGLAWLRREPTRLLEFGYRSPSWWERQPVELLTRATFVAGEAILQISFTALPTSSVSRSTAATGAPELEVLVRPSHRRFTDVGGSGTTREELRADATGCLTRIAPGILGGDRSYWIRVRILAGPTPTYRHKMLLLGLWTRPPRSASAGGSSGGKSAPAPGRGSN